MPSRRGAASTLPATRASQPRRRTYPRGELDFRVPISFQESEFICVQNDAAERGEVARAAEIIGDAELAGIGFALECELPCAADLFCRINTSVPFELFSEERGLLMDKLAVEQIQRLQWRRGARAPRLVLAGVRAIERAEGRVLRDADLRHVNHPPPLRR